MSEEIETYQYRIDCNNCGETNSLAIPKGVTVSMWKRNAVCKNCGCVLANDSVAVFNNPLNSTYTLGNIPITTTSKLPEKGKRVYNKHHEKELVWKPNNALTPKANNFVKYKLDNPKHSDTKAVLATYDTELPASAANIALKLRRNPLVMAELEKYSNQAELVLIAAMKADKKIYKFNPETKTNEYLGADPDHAIRLKAADSILDRVHGKATQKVENSTVAVNLNIDLSGAA